MERRTETLNLRVTSELKELVRLAAEREHRSPLRQTSCRLLFPCG